MNPFYRLLLIMVGVLGVYFPATLAGYNTVDDLKMINLFQNHPDWSLWSLFFPGGGYYYRPILGLTFFLELELHDLHPAILHFHNVLLHLFNTLLVYALTLKLLAPRARAAIWATVTALAFAWHPINTESVNWISGRTDLLAGMFLLLMIWFLFEAVVSDRKIFMLGSLVCFFLACLTKEVAVFVLPGALWCTIVYARHGMSLGQSIRRRLGLLLGIAATCAGYFLFRGFALRSKDSGVALIASQVTDQTTNIIDPIRIGFKVMGFYAKKMLVPWPLNFGIIDVSNGYIAIGMLLLLLCGYLIWRADEPSALLLTAVSLTSAGLLVAWGKAAWTPIAERYLYIPSAFFLLACVQWLTASVTVRLRPFLLFGAITVVLTVFLGSTFSRNLVWQDNVRLFSDTVQKSPLFVPAKNEFAAALLAAGRVEEAQEQITEVWLETGDRAYAPATINQARSLVKDGELDAAYELLLVGLSKAEKNYPHLLLELVSINFKRIALLKTNDQMSLYRENLGYLLEYRNYYPGSFIDYRIGKIYLALNENILAHDFLMRAYRNSKSTDHFHAPALKLAERLEGGR